MSDNHRLRVIKIGGSLLDKPEIANELQRWIAIQDKAFNILIVGGGMLVEAIHRYSQIHRTSDGDAHELCLSAMSVTARMFFIQWSGELPVCRSLVECRAGNASGGVCLLDVQEIFNDAATVHWGAMPRDWSVTSDSIAAYVASAIEAVELVLLKSASLPQPPSAERAAEMGYVDPYFPTLAGQLRSVRCVNFRDRNWPAWSLVNGTDAR